MKTLPEYRKRIDALDDQIIALLKERFEIVKNVGHYKAQSKVEVVQTGRVQEVLSRVRIIAAEKGLDPDFVESLYQTMIDHAHVLESGIRKSYEKTRTG